MTLLDVEEKGAANPVEQQPESNRQPEWHVVVLCVLTMFAYSFVWFYKNWKQLKAAASESDGIPEGKVTPQTRAALVSMRNCQPAWYTAGLFVPILHIVLAMQFFITAVKLYPRTNWVGGRHPLVAGAALTTVTIALLSLGFRPGLQYLLALNAALPLAFVQHLLNGLWQQIEPPEKIVRQAFSGGELIALVFGAIFLGLVVAGSGM